MPLKYIIHSGGRYKRSGRGVKKFSSWGGKKKTSAQRRGNKNVVPTEKREKKESPRKPQHGGGEDRISYEKRKRKDSGPNYGAKKPRIADFFKVTSGGGGGTSSFYKEKGKLMGSYIFRSREKCTKERNCPYTLFGRGGGRSLK